MFGDEDDYKATINYCCKIMTSDDVLMLKTLASRFRRAPTTVRRYLQRNGHGGQGLGEFFQDNSHLFFVENGRVARNNDEMEEIREAAVAYFKAALESYEDPVHFMKLKTQHLEDASDTVGSFVARFYPGKEFKHFLRSRPDVFVVYKDHTVFLIETETLAFFEKRLENCGVMRLPYMNFRGHVAQAPMHVQNYVNTYYAGDDFQFLLRNNADVFHVDDEGYVSLVSIN